MSTIPKEKFMCDFPKKKCKKQCMTCYVKYVYATDGREELEKDCESWQNSAITWEAKFNGLQSSLKEKEKECEENKRLYQQACDVIKKCNSDYNIQSIQIEELKAENERLNKVINSSLETSEKAIERISELEKDKQNYQETVLHHFEEIEALKKGLRKIEQMSDPGSPEAGIVYMKNIASELLKQSP